MNKSKIRANERAPKWMFSGTLFKVLIIAWALIFVIYLPLNATVSAQDSEIFSDTFSLQTRDSRFYVVHLEDNEHFELNLSAVNKGEFDVFLFSIRPNNTYVLWDDYDPKIFELAEVYDTSVGPFSHIEYTAPASTVFGSKLYYIQVVMVANGTDTFNLNASKHMEVYFIPFLPGFSIEGLYFTGALMVGIIYLRLRKKIELSKV